MNAQQLNKSAQDESLRNLIRVSKFVDSFVVNPADPPMGVTPKDVVWKRGQTRLYHYRSQTPQVYPVPYLIVPWLGISRTYVLDMLPGNSLVEFLVKQGHDVYLLDWGEFQEEDKDLGFEDAALKIVPRAIEKVQEVSNAKEITLNGVCLGGTVAASYLALTPDAPVRNFITIVSPIDFSQGGMLKTWLDERYFPADLIVQRYGGVPSALMGSAFKMLRPTLDVHASLGLWINLDRDDYITTFRAMSKWANDYIGMPGRFFSQLSKNLYFKNELAKGEFILHGRRIDLKKISQPLMVVSASQDYIVPPQAARGLMDLVSSTEREYVELPGGHISVFSGRQANKTLWPKMQQWLDARSR